MKVNIDEHRLSREVQCHHQHATALQQSVLVLVSARDSEGDKMDGANCNLQGTTDCLKKKNKNNGFLLP